MDSIIIKESKRNSSPHNKSANYVQAEFLVPLLYAHVMGVIIGPDVDYGDSISVV